MDAEARFETDEAFDDDYLHFYGPLLADEVSDDQARLIWELLELQEAAETLDLACGHGRIANRLAARGAKVTGLDVTPAFLERARRDAERRRVSVTYVEGDMRHLPWEEQFDAVVCVFTAYGYFHDDDNRRVLGQVRKVLRPGGRFWLDLNHLPWLLANFKEQVVTERDGDLMIDLHSYDPELGRVRTRRTVIRDGRQRTFDFFVRMFTFPELRDWLLQSGFIEVAVHAGDGGRLAADSPRMLVIAQA